MTDIIDDNTKHVIKAKYGIYTCILATNDYLYAGNETGYIQCYCIDVNTNNLELLYAMPTGGSAITSLLWHSDGNIYSGHDDGRVLRINI